MKSAKTTGEIPHQFMDCKKISRYFKWKPHYTFERGIKETINWYKKYITK